MASPKFFIRTVKVSHLNGGRLVLSDGTIFSCLAFDHYLENCGSVCVFVATLGGDIDLCIQKSFGDNFQPLQALCLGTAGWLMIEATTRSILTYLQSDFSRQGKRITMRLGPGYNYPQYGGGRTSWDLSEQLQLFNLFKGVPIPISLTEGFSMQPTMSRSGLVGLSKI